jgi:hypothetical protein
MLKRNAPQVPASLSDLMVNLTLNCRSLSDSMVNLTLNCRETAQPYKATLWHQSTHWPRAAVLHHTLQSSHSRIPALLRNPCEFNLIADRSTVLTCKGGENSLALPSALRTTTLSTLRLAMKASSTDQRATMGARPLHRRRNSRCGSRKVRTDCYRFSETDVL